MGLCAVLLICLSQAELARVWSKELSAQLNVFGIGYYGYSLQSSAKLKAILLYAEEALFLACYKSHMELITQKTGSDMCSVI
ncbi:plexin domain-containing protein 1 isoform X1 [Tachysurus ichikawai]